MDTPRNLPKIFKHFYIFLDTKILLAKSEGYLELIEKN